MWKNAKNVSKIVVLQGLKFIDELYMHHAYVLLTHICIRYEI